MKPFVNISLMAALLSVAACSDDNGPDEDWCLDPSYKVPLDVTINLDSTFTAYREVDSLFNTRSESETPYLRYFAAAYPSNPGLPVIVESSLDNVVRMNIHPGKYTMAGWMSYECDPEKPGGMYFYTDDFDELLLRNKFNYSGASPEKVAYRGDTERNIAYNTSSTSVDVRPAMALYRIVATDSAKFIPARTVVKYTSMLPSAVSGKTGEINWWWSDISYSTPLSGDTIASDFVFSRDTETSVTVVVEIYDADGNICARKKNVEIPLINGGVTTVRGNFYSVRELDNVLPSGNGITIDTEWDATFEIEI